MSLYEVEVNRLRKEIGKLKSEIEDLREERDLQEDELVELRFGKEVMIKEINELKSLKKTIEDKMYEQINKKVNEERKKLEDCQAILIKTQEELTKVKREKTIQEDELEQEKHMVDTLKQQNHQMASKLKEEGYLNNVNKYEESRKKQMSELKNIREQLAETKRQAEHIMAENKVLRKLANVPENYGFDLEDVKIAEQEKLEDYKKQVRFLEREIEQLEEDRTNLRSRLRATALMKNDGSHLLVDATFKKQEIFERLQKELTNENISLKKEVQELSQELQNKESKKSAPSDKMSDDALKQMQAYQEEIKKHLSYLVNNQNENTEVVVKKQDDQNLHRIEKDERGDVYAEFAHHKMAPQPKSGEFGNLGDIREGYSSKFKQNIQVDMYDLYSDGGLDQIQAKHEIAQLQLMNIELVKSLREKENEYKNMQEEVRLMQEDLKKSLLIQDQLFINNFKQVQEFKFIQDQNQKDKEKMEEELLYLQQKYNILEQFRVAIESSGIDSEGTIEDKLSQMTKRTAILDVNMIKLARKYKALEEEYSRINEQYINADKVHSEVELEMKTKILSLQAWKKSAQISMKILFEQTVNSASKEDFLSMVERNSSLNDQIANLKIEVADQRKQIADYKGKDREILEKDEQIKILQDEINDINLEFDILKKRLEEMDPQFKKFQECFNRIIKKFNETRISPLKFFQLMEGDKKAPVTKIKFEQAMLQHLNIELKESEINVLFKFIDIDCTDTMEYNEFLKKLRRGGVNIRNNDEQELFKLYENMLKAGLTLKQMYDLFDSDNDGCITKAEMKVGFDRFMRTKSDETVDYIFKLCDSSGEGKVTFNEWQTLFENTVKDSMLQQTLTQNLELDWKKEVMIQVHEGCISSGYQLLDLYKIIDIGDKQTMTKYDLRNLMQNLKVNLNQMEIDALFNDIDADGSQEIDYSELLHYIRQAKREKDKIQRQIDIKRRAEKMNQNQEMEMRKLNQELQSLQNSDSKVEQSSKKDMIISMQEVKLINLTKKYDMQSVQLNNQEKQNFKLKTRLKEQEKDLENAKKEYYKERQKSIDMQNRIQSCITKEESESLKEYNKKLQIEIVELKSALKTFKSLYSSTSEQIQVLKTTVEKYKHQHDIYQGAIKEMQSQSDDRSLIGRLYHQVMLAHWEVGEMHAKYQKILDNYQQAQMQNHNLESEISKLEVDYRFLYMDFDSKMKTNLKEITSLKGKLIPTVNLSKIEELHNKLAELCQMKVELEVANRKIREENYQLTLKVDYYETQIEGVDKLKEDLKSSHSDELQQKLILYSTKISELKLESMRSKRETMLAQEKESFFQRLNMQNQEQIKDFEKQLSEQHMKFAERETYWRTRQGEVLKTLTQLNQKEIEWKEETSKAGGDQMKQVHQENYQRKIGRVPQKKSSEQELKVYEDGDEQEDVIEKEFGIKLQQGSAQEVKILQQEQVKHQNEKIELLKQIEDLKILCSSLEEEKNQGLQEIEVLKQGNADLIHKQLREVQITKESIEKITENAIKEESEKLAMVAQQTIESLSKVIEDKNQALIRKDKFIDKIQKEFLEEKQKDNEEIRRLSNMYIANNMQKTEQVEVIQAKHENESIQTTLYWEEVGKLLKEKDKKIAELADRHDNEIKEVQKYKRKSEDLHDELVLVSQELQIEKQRNNIGTLKKQIEALQNLNKLKDDQIKNFKQNLQTLKEEFKLLTAKPEEMRNNMEELKKQRDNEKKGKLDVEQQLNKAVDAIKKINLQVQSQKDEVENLNLTNNQNQAYISQLEFDSQKQKELIKTLEKQILTGKQQANKKIDEQKINDILVKDKAREKELQELRMKNADLERQINEKKPVKRPVKKGLGEEERKD